MSHRRIFLAALGSVVLVVFLGILAWTIRQQRTQPDVSAPAKVISAAPVAGNPISGTARRVYITSQVSTLVTAQNALAIAKGLIAEARTTLKGTARSDELFRFDAGSPHELRLATQTDHPGGNGLPETHTLRFEQRYRSIPVEGSNLQVVLSSEGTLTSLGADVFPDLAMDVTPKVAREQAVVRANAELTNGLKVSPDDLELRILPPAKRNAPFALQWVGTAKGDSWRTLPVITRIDAVTSTVEFQDLPIDALGDFFPDADAAGAVTQRVQANIPRNRPNDPKELRPVAGAKVSVGGTMVTTDEDGAYTGTGAATTTLESSVVESYLDGECNGSSSNPCTSTTSANGTGAITWDVGDTETLGKITTFHAISAEKAATVRWGYTKYSGKTLNVTRIASLQSREGPIHCNAFWTSGSNLGLSTYDSVIFLFLTGSDDTLGGCPIPNDFELFPDVTYHEYGHGVMYHEYDQSMLQTKEGGAISEGFADFMACVMNGDPALQPLDTPNLGNRRCDSTATYAQLNTLCGGDPACHNGGNIFSSALYGALTSAGVDRDAFMRATLRALSQHAATMKDFGDAVISSAGGDAAIINGLKTSFTTHGITLTAAGGGPTCGDGVVTAPEVCDGASFGTKTCASETGGVRPNGQLRCEANCSLVSNSLCTGTGTPSSVPSSTPGTSGSWGTGTGGTGGPTGGIQQLAGHDFTLYVPAGYAEASPTPLVVLIPGQGGTARSVIQTGWQTIADTDGVILASLDIPNTGMAGPQFNILDDLLNTVPTKYNIAVNHISLWGFSAGAHATLAIGLAFQDDLTNADYFNALAVQAGSLTFSRQNGSWPTLPQHRRIPIFLHIGANDAVVGVAGVQSDRDDLRAAGYTVDYAEIPGQDHRYTIADVQAAWAFLKGESLTTGTTQACATDGCATLNAIQCVDGQTLGVCTQKGSGSSACLGITETACQTGTVCQNQGALQAACINPNSSTPSSLPSSSSSSLPSSSTSSTPSSTPSTLPPSSSSIINPSSLPAGACGNGVRENAEVCDTSDLSGVSCQTLGFASGSLVCVDCKGYDVSACTKSAAGNCGDGVLNASEQCDDGNNTAHDGCSATCDVEREVPTTVRAILPDMSGAATTGSPYAFDCRRSIGYALACDWDFGDGTTSLGLADYTKDSVVDDRDLLFFVDQVYTLGRTTAPAGTSFDLNSDGRIDILDLQELLTHASTWVTSHTYTGAATVTVVLTVSGQNRSGETVRDQATGQLRVTSGVGGVLIASAGQDETVAPGADVTLLGSAQGGQTPYSFVWAQVGGSPTAIISDRTAAVARFTMPLLATGQTALTFELNVRDSAGTVAKDRVDVGMTALPPSSSVPPSSLPPTLPPVGCSLPTGTLASVLELNTRAYEGLSGVKSFLPTDPDAARVVSKILPAVDEYLTKTQVDTTVDPLHRFIVGVQAGATNALIGGLGNERIAGVIHVDQDSIHTCAATDTNCTTLQSVLTDALSRTRRTPVAITYKKGSTNAGLGTARALIAAGWVLDSTLFVFETTGDTPTDTERGTIFEWMLHHPSDGSCTITTPLSNPTPGTLS